jgi:hypothetical protein
MVRAVTAVIALAVSLSACTLGRSDGEAGGETTTSAPEQTEAPDTTTTTAAPIIRGLAVELGLLPGQCYAAVPEPTTTTTEPTTTTNSSTEGSDSADETTTTVAATTEATAPPSTIPQPRTVAVVECSGTREGVVYGAMCLGSLLATDRIVTEPRDLGVVTCPGDSLLPWPGERTLRRAAARVCLEIFEELYGEPYALSEVATVELVPSRGVWEQGDRRVVCGADQPVP